MKRSSLLGIAGALGLASMVAMGGPVSAESGTLRIGRDPNFGGGVNGLGGGEFNIFEFTGMTPATMNTPPKVAGAVFQTFCLEKNEDLSGAQPFNWSLSDAARNGGGSAALGASQDINGEWFDPISPETAYLYTHFWNGDLPGYLYNDPVNRAYSAGSLQQAIWILENDVPEHPGTLDPYCSTLLALARDAVSSGAWSGIGNVRVLNLTDASGVRKQDVPIVIDPPKDDCCGYKELTFKYVGPDCVKICAIDPSHTGGYYKTSLSSWCSVKSCTTFTVYAGDCWTSGKFEDDIKLVVKNRCGTIIECTTVGTDCVPKLVVGTVYGSFILTGFKEACCKPQTKDPKCGPKSWSRDCDGSKGDNCKDDKPEWCGTRDRCDRGELKDCADWRDLKDCKDFKDNDCDRSYRFFGGSGWNWSSWCKR